MNQRRHQSLLVPVASALVIAVLVHVLVLGWVLPTLAHQHDLGLFYTAPPESEIPFFTLLEASPPAVNRPLSESLMAGQQRPWEILMREYNIWLRPHRRPWEVFSTEQDRWMRPPRRPWEVMWEEQDAWRVVSRPWESFAEEMQRLEEEALREAEREKARLEKEERELIRQLTKERLRSLDEEMQDDEGDSSAIPRARAVEVEEGDLPPRAGSEG